MKSYITRANVLGLNRGDTFSSDDEFYANIAKSGILEEVIEDGGSTPSDQLVSAAQGTDDSVGEGDDGSGSEGGGESQGTLPE